MKRTVAAAAFWLMAWLPAAAEETIRATEAWARATILPSRPGAAYLTIESSAGDRLVGATTPIARRVVVHAIESDGGVSRMKHVEALEIPAGEQVVLAPGGMHLMLMELRDRLTEGATFPLILTFEKAGAITIEVSVLGIAADGPREAAR